MNVPKREADGFRRYGRWDGNPAGQKEDKARCAFPVFDQWVGHQCSRKRGHGPGGEFCKVHAKRYEGDGK